MTQFASEVLGRLADLGISVTAAGDHLELRPGSRVPADLIPEVRRCKPEILSLVSVWPNGMPSAVVAMYRRALRELGPAAAAAQLQCEVAWWLQKGQKEGWRYVGESPSE